MHEANELRFLINSGYFSDDVSEKMEQAIQRLLALKEQLEDSYQNGYEMGSAYADGTVNFYDNAQFYLEDIGDIVQDIQNSVLYSSVPSMVLVDKLYLNELVNKLKYYKTL